MNNDYSSPTLDNSQKNTKDDIDGLKGKELMSFNVYLSVGRRLKRTPGYEQPNWSCH